MSSDPIYFAPLRVPLIDPRTGLMARDWYLFFQALFLRTGGTSAPNQDDLAMGLPITNVMPDLAALQMTLQDLLAQGPNPLPLQSVDSLGAEVAELRELVATLATAVQDMRQAAIPI